MKAHIDSRQKAVAIEYLFNLWKGGQLTTEGCVEEFFSMTGYIPTNGQMHRYFREYQQLLDNADPNKLLTIKRCVQHFENLEQNRKKYSRATAERADEIIEQIGWNEPKAKKKTKIKILWGLIELQF